MMNKTVVWVLLIIGSCFTGCTNSGPDLYTFSGKVTHQGKPVEKLFIKFTPDDLNTKSESVAISDEHGNFNMLISDTSGVFPGSHTVSCQDPLKLMGGKTSDDPGYLACIKKYAPGKSEMKVEVSKNTSGYELKFD